MRMRLWKVISEDEEKKYLIKRNWSPMKDIMPVGENFTIGDSVVFVHHINNQEGWWKDATLHPSYTPGTKPAEGEWKCDFKHTYKNCKCHLELREYGQDDSVYNSGDNPSSRWGIDGRSYAISKSKGISRMVSVFKDYTKRGLCLAMTAEEFQKVSDGRIRKQYTDGTNMESLEESPGICVINPTKAGDGYWDYNKIARQTENVMDALDALEPNIQHVYNYDWSSGHAKIQEGGLLISSMTMKYGGAGGKH